MKQSIYLETALEAAKKAEKLILKYYKEKLEVSYKEDDSPVTKADKEAEKLIREVISKKFPKHGFLGEELGTDIKEFTWIIDPIDGTRNYLRKIPIFGTEIALMKNNELILGVSNVPLQKELMFAEKGKGAFLNNTPIKVSSINKINKAMVLHGGLHIFVLRETLPFLIALIKDAERDRGISDCYMYHLIASGRADIAVDSRLHIYDIAAMSIIIQEAGGKVSDLKGNPINLNTTSFLATNKLLHETTLSYFSKGLEKGLQKVR